MIFNKHTKMSTKSRKERIEDLSTEFKEKYNISKMKGMTIELPKPEYGSINILQITLENKDALPLVSICGYSYASFENGARILMSGYEHLKTKYSCIYMICWTDEIKEITSNTSDRDKHDEFKSIFAGILNKILHKLEITKCSVLGKSAGGGISIYLTSINPDVQYLYLACPALTLRAKPLENRQVPIKLMWCKDDTILPYSIHQDFLSDFEKQKKEYSFYSYNKGGHELYEPFILEL